MPASNALTVLMKFGVPHPGVMIRDFAAAGLIRSRAATVERFEVDGIRSITDNEELSDELWKRIVREGVVEAVWLDGAVHLCAAPITEEEPHIVVTGIQFAAIDIHMLGYRHRGYVTKKGEAAPNAPISDAAHAAAMEAAAAPTQEQAIDPASALEATRPLKGRKRRTPDPRCLIPRFDGVILSLGWKEAIWDRYVTGAPRPRTPSEQQYSDRKLRSRR